MIYRTTWVSDLATWEIASVGFTNEADARQLAADLTEYWNGEIVFVDATADQIDIDLGVFDQPVSLNEEGVVVSPLPHKWRT